MVREVAPAQEFLQYRLLGLLHLQEQRVLAVAADQQCDPRASADAANPDHLAGEVGQVKLLEQHTPVELEGLAIAAHQPPKLLEYLIAPMAGRELL